ncbi:MAG TPA: hypothetical protein VLK30_01895 [Candidatus Limnocylindrales bacterium]|nr:hypothetical protein [Candidatus Limnocylindrales bacterium]
MRWVALLVLALLACGSSGPPPAREYAAADAQNGLTLKVRAGDTVRVTLGSTTWTIAGSSDPAVLEQESAQVVSPAPTGQCVAGEGCGTTSAVFRALKHGVATIDASRVSCGEARLCAGAEGSYQVTVQVG